MDRPRLRSKLVPQGARCRTPTTDDLQRRSGAPSAAPRTRCGGPSTLGAPPRQADLARLRIGIVGLGSVGCLVAETLARMGVERVVLVDADRVEAHNLDRLLYAGKNDVGRLKVELAADGLRRSATAAEFQVDGHAGWLQQRDCFSAALDCDILFSCVDRPLPKDLMNHIAYAHCIRSSSEGCSSTRREDGTLGQATWSVSVRGPGVAACAATASTRHRMSCSSETAPWTTPATSPGWPAASRRTRNVFPFSANLASLMTLEMLRIVVGDDWWPRNAGKVHYSYVPGSLNLADEQCREHCEVEARTALGDRAIYPFLEETPRPEQEEPRTALARLADGMRLLLRRLARR